jgi:hypothetical protein
VSKKRRHFSDIIGIDAFNVIIEKAINSSKRNNMKNGPVTSPVKYGQNGNVSIQSKVSKDTDFLDDFPEDAQPEVCSDSCGYGVSQEEKDRRLDENLAKVKFADQIKIDFIPSIDYRILCRFLGVTTVNEITNHPFQSQPLITLILMESIDGFMRQEGYDMVGELNFDDHGNSIPPEKNPWNIKGKETTFTITGFLFFEKIKGQKTDNVAFFLFADLERGGASITCYSTDTNKSKDIVKDLQQYAKKNNCLRGAKLKDVNMITASFSEVDIVEDFTWNNYYYSDEIKDLFQLEVFDFITNVEKYNECGINKRGIILHGRPGCGKTTIGNIICNMTPKNTVIWITPEILSENNYRAMSSIKALYKLADFLSPCIIMLEDLDLFSQDRDMGGDVLSLGALMNILDGVNTISNSVTIGTTNRLKSIETALRNRPGRFDRIVEIESLSTELRIKMLKERLDEWKVSQATLDYIVGQTKDWTGAEVQEFINSLNLKHISSKRKIRKMDQAWAEEIIATLSNFGVGDASSGFGFSKKD